MRVLFAISVLCLCAVLWVAISIARHVLATRLRRRPAQRPQDGFAEVFFEDKMQQLREHTAIGGQAVASASTNSSWMSAPLRPEVQELPVARPANPAFAEQAPVVQPPARHLVPPFPVAPIVATPPGQPVSTQFQPVSAEVPLPRKAPQPVTANGLHRADWDYFNKDLGDLTDPYENTLRDRSEAKSGTRP